MLYFAVWRVNFKKILIAIIGIMILYQFCAWGVGWFRQKTISVLSWSAASKIVIIDAGHGGSDPGAIGPNGTLEKNITLPIALRLSEYLSQSGAMVILTRDEDEDLGKSKSLRQRKKEDLEERYKIVANSNADIYVNIQVNSYRGRNYRPGGQVFYYRGNEEGKSLARHVQNELKRIMQNTDREPLPLDIFMLRKVSTPGVVVEVGFISNPEEEKLLNDKAYQSKIAYAIFSGIVRYLSDEKTDSLKE